MSAEKAMNMRSRVYALQSKLSCAAKQSLVRRFGALYDKMYREDVLWEAWRRVRANRGAPGVDEQDFIDIENGIGVERFLHDLQTELHDQEYRPQPVLRCWVDKPGKPEKRPLGIPVIRDRVVQMAMKLVMEPIFETNFLENSHGFRPNRSPHTAIAAIDHAITKERYTEVIDADIKGCFDNIRHDILLELLERRISDRRILRLIRGWLKAGIMENGTYESVGECGTPQGGVISPLLCNIYLHSLDRMFQMSGIKGKLIRYADDLVILLQRDAAEVLTKVKAMLGRLGLQMHPEKTRIVSARKGFDFLGVHFRLRPVTRKKGARRESCRIWPSNKSMNRIREKIRQTVGRRYCESLERMIEEVNPVIRGWNNYHTFNRWARSARRRFERLNCFVRERLRIFLKRKYRDQSNDGWRVADNILVRLGLAQFGWH